MHGGKSEADQRVRNDGLLLLRLSNGQESGTDREGTKCRADGLRKVKQTDSELAIHSPGSMISQGIRVRVTPRFVLI